MFNKLKNLAGNVIAHHAGIEDKGEIMAGIINLLSKSEEYVDDNRKFIQYVCDIVKKYKQENVNEDNNIV